jgi:hypothetical protein
MKIYSIKRLKVQAALIVLAAMFLTLSTGLSSASSAGFQKDKGKKEKKSKKGGSTAAPQTAGTPALWRDPGDVSALNLFWGIGGEDTAPKPPFTFDKEDVTGTNPKIKVIDANGVKWNVKFDEEVHAEVASSRLVWACGYMVEESYYMPSGTVSGVTGLNRAKKFVGAGGSFTNAMFEKRPDDVARRNIRWSWDSNPFSGTKEYSGLIILIAILNNWDAKIDNNNVLGMYDEDGKTVKDWYILSDWGASFGDGRSTFHQSKWEVRNFTKLPFIEEVANGSLKFHYSGKLSRAVRLVPVAHAKWFAGIIGQLSDDQLRDAFRAAGATDEEIRGFSGRLRQKIDELKAAAK